MSRILVVDDDLVVLESTRRILEAENHVVDCVADGRLGVQWAIAKDYDLVVSDIRMPGSGGLEILTGVKRVKPDVPVIMITGYGGVQSAMLYIRSGAFDYLEKPVQPEVLLEAVTEALHGSTDALCSPETRGEYRPS